MTDYGTPTGYYRRDGRFVPPADSDKPCRRDERGMVFVPSNRPKNRIGITDELPRWRTIGWNVVFVAVEAGLIVWAHFVVGVSWSTIGGGLAAILAFGIALITYAVKVHTPRAIRRHHELLQSYRTATARTATAHNGHRPVQPVHTATPGPDEVVDRQSTPHLTAPTSSSNPPLRVSRAR